MFKTRKIVIFLREKNHLKNEEYCYISNIIMKVLAEMCVLVQMLLAPIYSDTRKWENTIVRIEK